MLAVLKGRGRWHCPTPSQRATTRRPGECHSVSHRTFFVHPIDEFGSRPVHDLEVAVGAFELAWVDTGRTDGHEREGGRTVRHGRSVSCGDEHDAQRIHEAQPRRGDLRHAGRPGPDTAHRVVDQREHQQLAPHEHDPGAWARWYNQQDQDEAGFEASQQKRKLNEELFGWFKQFGGLRRSRLVGRWKIQQLADITRSTLNMVRMVKLLKA